MEKMLIGAYIKQKREDKGWSQDALCEGICSRSNLSRIENDDQTPSFTLLEKLFEKLGQPSRQFLMLMDRDSIAGENLKKRIRNDSVLYQETEGEERALIRERILKDLKKLGTQCGKDNCFIQKKISEFRYTEIEVILLNKLARTYSMSGDRKKAIGVLRQLLQYIEKNSQSLDSYPRQFCLVAYNYAIDLALEKDYERSIRYAEKCCEVGNANGYHTCLPGCMAILGECYFFLGDRKRSRDCYTQAFYLFKAYGNKRDLATVRQEMRERLRLEMPG